MEGGTGWGDDGKRGDGHGTADHSITEIRERADGNQEKNTTFLGEFYKNHLHYTFTAVFSNQCASSLKVSFSDYLPATAETIHKDEELG